MSMENISIGNVTLENFFVFIFTFIFTLIVGNLIYTLLRKLLDERISKRASKFTARAMQYVIIGIGLYYGVYHILSLDLTALAASLGIIGIAIAFSSQQIIQNLMSGILISIERPIQPEDWVEIGGFPQTGISRVKDIKLTKTVLRDRDGRLIYIPNSVLMSSKIINYTKSGFLEIPIQLTVPYGSDIEKIKRTIKEIADENKRMLPNVPRRERSSIIRPIKLPHIKSLFEKKVDMSMFEPKIMISDVSNSKITLSIRVWIRDVDKKNEIVSEFFDVLLKKFKEKKIKLA